MNPKIRVALYAAVALITVVVWWQSRQAPAPAPDSAPTRTHASDVARPPQTAAPSEDAAPRTDVAFRSHQRLVDHYAKHGTEFGDISMAEYLRQAQELRDATAGDEVLEIVRSDGVITRFDRSSGAFLAFNRDLTIRTYFRPRQGETYFRRQARRGR